MSPDLTKQFFQKQFANEYEDRQNNVDVIAEQKQVIEEAESIIAEKERKIAAFDASMERIQQVLFAYHDFIVAQYEDEKPKRKRTTVKKDAPKRRRRKDLEPQGDGAPEENSDAKIQEEVCDETPARLVDAEDFKEAETVCSTDKDSEEPQDESYYDVEERSFPDVSDFADEDGYQLNDDDYDEDDEAELEKELENAVVWTGTQTPATQDVKKTTPVNPGAPKLEYTEDEMYDDYEYFASYSPSHDRTVLRPVDPNVDERKGRPAKYSLENQIPGRHILPRVEEEDRIYLPRIPGTYLVNPATGEVRTDGKLIGFGHTEELDRLREVSKEDRFYHKEQKVFIAKKNVARYVADGEAVKLLRLGYVTSQPNTLDCGITSTSTIFGRFTGLGTNQRALDDILQYFITRDVETITVGEYVDYAGINYETWANIWSAGYYAKKYPELNLISPFALIMEGPGDREGVYDYRDAVIRLALVGQIDEAARNVLETYQNGINYAHENYQEYRRQKTGA